MDFGFFRRNILPPENYAMTRTEREGSDLVELHVPYMLVYNTFSEICKEQREIVENHEDTTTLSAVLSRLPRLNELGLCFCQTLAKERWVPFFMDQTVESSTYGHHLWVISNALKVGRDHGIFLHNIHLSGLELPYYCSLDTSESQALSIQLFGLLRCVRILRLSGSGSPIESLSHVTLPLQQLELCCLSVHQATLHEFLQNNSSSIDSIGFHNIKLIGPNFTGSNSAVISPEMCRGTLRINWTIMCWTSFPCIICGHDGWRLSKV